MSKKRKNFYKEQFSRRSKSNRRVLQPEEAYRFARKKKSKKGYKKARSVRITGKTRMTGRKVDKVCYSISEAARSVSIRNGEDVGYKEIMSACASGNALHGFKCRYAKAV